jgi:hypothetical protein
MTKEYEINKLRGATIYDSLNGATRIAFNMQDPENITWNIKDDHSMVITDNRCKKRRLHSTNMRQQQWKRMS